jgi:hydroxymethylpyrimidine pyrophosphatase-like HAD family hydrolase
MKTLYINSNGALIFDKEADRVSSIENKREAISRIMLAEEPMHIVYEDKDTRDEFDVEKDDLIIKFYDYDFPHKAIKITSKEWLENIRAYDERQKKSKDVESICTAYCDATSCCNEQKSESC